MLIKKTVLTSFLIWGAIASSNASDLKKFLPLDLGAIEQALSLQDITSPDALFEDVLQSGTASQSLWIIDVDGTLTNEEDPGTLKITKKPATLRGNAVKNIRAQIQQGAEVIFCSAWEVLEETVDRLHQIGFNDKDLGIEEGITQKESGVKNVTLTDHLSVSLHYQKHGRVISTKRENLRDRYFRNKAFSAFFIDSEQPHSIQNIYFLDDSSTNTQIFKQDMNEFHLFTGKKVSIYQIKKPR